MKIKNILLIYGDLIKAKQTILLIYTGIFAFLITTVEKSLDFNGVLFFYLLLSLFLAISGSTVLNMFIDKDIDAIMERTKERPLPSGKVSGLTVLINGIVLTFLGILTAFLALDILSAFIIFLGFFFDVVVYTILLKRRTKYNIIFGGIAGGLPAMAGRTVILGSVDLVGIYFLLFILTWIPVHILTLALIPENYDGYKKAGVPMWPIVSSRIGTMRVIALSALISSFLLYLSARLLIVNTVILIIIGLFCIFLIILVIKNLFKPSDKLTFMIFKIASLYMLLGFFLLFIGVVVP